MRLLPTRALVHETNIKRLSELGKPVVRCKAKHNCPAARKASEEDADGLEAEILLAEGAKVMVTRNLWTAKGVYQNIKKQVWAWLTQIYIQV